MRKYWIKRFNKHNSGKDKDTAPTDEPLTKTQRMKMINQSMETSNSNDSNKLSNHLMSSMRNKG